LKTETAEEISLLARMFAAFGFSHSHAVCAAFVRQSRIYSTGYSNIGILAGYAVLFREDPKAAGSVINLVNALAQSSVGTCYAADHRNFPVEITPGIAVYLGDSHSRRAARHLQRRYPDHNSHH